MINRPRRSKKPVTKITRAIAKKVLAVVDAGLVKGLGNAKPGQMCVEAAVCYAMGLPHGDDPSCVAPALRSLKIRINDSNWSSNEARAKGLRRLALAQLGSAGFLDESEFIRRLCNLVIKKVLPGTLRIAASVHPIEKHKVALILAAESCEQSSDAKSAREARQIALEAKIAAYASAAYAAYASAYASAAYADAAYAYAAAAAYASAADADAASAADAADAAADAAYASAADAADAADAAYASAADAADAASAADAADAAAYAAYAADAAYASAAYASAADAAADAADAAADAAYASAADAADAADADAADADAADAAYKKKTEARDNSLAAFCEWVVQILIDMKVPGCQWLDLAEAA